jgi:hypothetical protein
MEPVYSTAAQVAAIKSDAAFARFGFPAVLAYHD